MSVLPSTGVAVLTAAPRPSGTTPRPGTEAPPRRNRPSAKAPLNFGRSGERTTKLKASGTWANSRFWVVNSVTLLKSGVPAAAPGVGFRVNFTSRTTAELNLRKMGMMRPSTLPKSMFEVPPAKASMGRSPSGTSPASPQAVRVPQVPAVMEVSLGVPSVLKHTPARPCADTSLLMAVPVKPRKVPAGSGTTWSMALPIFTWVSLLGPRSCAIDRSVIEPGIDMPAMPACTFEVAGACSKVPL
ncbi:MAG: hypothetical protein ACYC8T_37990 [Myxococcaceae bacterium]